MKWVIPVLLAASITESQRIEIETWRKTRAERLIAADGWTTLVGLFWLQPGANTVGSAESSAVVLPKGTPERTGVLELSGHKVTFRPAPGVDVKINGAPAKASILKNDHESEKPELVQTGTVTFYVIDRGGKLGIRVRDEKSTARTGFKGLIWYPIKPEWRLDARWVKYPQPKKVSYTTTAGIEDHLDGLGYAEFPHEGKTYRLEAVEDDGQLMFVFRDLTSKTTTYPAARFVKAPIPKDDHVVLDFNRAYNPPCVFTPYATCPLPKPEQRLPFEIPAGEKRYQP